MNATDELRRLLDERGIEWGTNETLTDCWTRWEADKFLCTATEINGIFAFTVGNSTPEQAIAATLGRETCKVEDSLPERTCTNIADRYNDFECSECGARWGGFLRGVFHYCPECGANVVD